MRPEPPAAAMIGISIGLLLLSGLLSDDALSTPAIAILFFLSLEAWMHTFRARRVLERIEVAREVKPLIVRQGGSACLRTMVKLPGESAMAICIEDRVPVATEIVEGVASAQIGGGSHEAMFSYRLKILGCGKLPFAGVILECRDLFFSSAHILKGDRFSKPCILAMPSASGAESPGLWGEFKESRRAFIPASQMVKEFRRFRAGDDSRRIDWKLSAKRGILMVRELHGMQTSTAFVFLDLPERLSDRRSFERLLSSASALVEKILADGAKVDVCVISGANLVKIERIAGTTSRWYHLQGELRPGDSFVPLIRYSSIAFRGARARDMRRRLGERERSGDPRSKAFERIVTILERNSRIPQEIPFEKQVHALFEGRARGEMIAVFTLLQGDTSHIRLLLEAAASRNLLITLHTSAMAMRGRQTAELERMSVHRMEAIG